MCKSNHTHASYTWAKGIQCTANNKFVVVWLVYTHQCQEEWATSLCNDLTGEYWRAKMYLLSRKGALVSFRYFVDEACGATSWHLIFELRRLLAFENGSGKSHDLWKILVSKFDDRYSSWTVPRTCCFESLTSEGHYQLVNPRFIDMQSLHRLLGPVDHSEIWPIPLFPAALDTQLWSLALILNHTRKMLFCDHAFKGRYQLVSRALAVLSTVGNFDDWYFPWVVLRKCCFGVLDLNATHH